jgi:hypothetical protein
MDEDEDWGASNDKWDADDEFETEQDVPMAFEEEEGEAKKQEEKKEEEEEAPARAPVEKKRKVESLATEMAITSIEMLQGGRRHVQVSLPPDTWMRIASMLSFEDATQRLSSVSVQTALALAPQTVVGVDPVAEGVLIPRSVRKTFQIDRDRDGWWSEFASIRAYQTQQYRPAMTHLTMDRSTAMHLTKSTHARAWFRDRLEYLTRGGCRSVAIQDWNYWQLALTEFAAEESSKRRIVEEKQLDRRQAEERKQMLARLQALEERHEQFPTADNQAAVDHEMARQDVERARLRKEKEQWEKQVDRKDSKTQVSFERMFRTLLFPSLQKLRVVGPIDRTFLQVGSGGTGPYFSLRGLGGIGPYSFFF